MKTIQFNLFLTFILTTFLFAFASPHPFIQHTRKSIVVGRPAAAPVLDSSEPNAPVNLPSPNSTTAEPGSEPREVVEPLEKRGPAPAPSPSPASPRLGRLRRRRPMHP